MSLAVSQPATEASHSAELTTVSNPRPMLARLWLRIPIFLLLVAIACLACSKGLEFRRWAWDYTAQRNLRYYGDVSNGFGWGRVSNSVNLFNVYDLYSAGRINGPNGLDYTPLRLTIVTLWNHWAETKLGYTGSWNGSYELTWFMLTANTTAEFLSSVFVFLLIRHWIIRHDNATRPLLSPAPPFRGVFRGLLGAAFFWFNPAVVWDGHCFPQWDVWNAPFFLAAAYLACCEGWFAAGLCVVIGAFLKGQILLVAPIFLIWPIAQGRPGSAIRFICGFVLGGAMIALPWFNVSKPAIIWFLMAMAAIGLGAIPVLHVRLNWIAMTIFAVLVTALAWPWTSDAQLPLRFLAISVVLGTSLFYFAPPRMLPSLYALCAGILLLLLIPLYHGSSAWFSQGFEYGTKKLMWMATDRTYSLPWFLEAVYRWSDDPRVLVTMPQGFPLFGKRLEFRDLMLYIHAAGLLLCGIAAARHSRRGDPRFLVTLVAPWLIWFAFLTQLNNRYMIWAAGFSALLVGVSWGMALLGLVTTAIGWLAINDILHWPAMRGDPFFNRTLVIINEQMIFPIILLAAIYLYVAIAPSKKQQRRLV